MKPNILLKSSQPLTNITLNLVDILTSMYNQSYKPSVTVYCQGKKYLPFCITESTQITQLEKMKNRYKNARKKKKQNGEENIDKGS